MDLTQFRNVWPCGTMLGPFWLILDNLDIFPFLTILADLSPSPPKSSLWVTVGHCGYLRVTVGHCGSFWVKLVTYCNFNIPTPMYLYTSQYLFTGPNLKFAIKCQCYTQSVNMVPNSPKSSQNVPRWFPPPKCVNLVNVGHLGQFWAKLAILGQNGLRGQLTQGPESSMFSTN